MHRDVKPSNVLFDNLGRARLADFGIARLAGGPSLTGTGEVIGSAPYLAPEQVATVQAGPAADVYSLGLVVIECLTGRRCYPGGHVEAALARLQRPPSIPSDLPRWLCDVLSAMTARDPTRRPSATAAAETFRRRNAETALAATTPRDVDATTTSPEVLAATAPHNMDATTTSPDVLAATAPHDVDATTALRDVAAGETVTTRHATPADGTALLEHGAPARSCRVRPPSARRIATLLAAAVITVLVVSLLAWMVRGGGPAGDPLPGRPGYDAQHHGGSHYGRPAAAVRNQRR